MNTLMLLLSDAAAQSADGEDIFAALLILAGVVFAVALIVSPLMIWKWVRRSAQQQEETNERLERIENVLLCIADAQGALDVDEDEDEDDEDVEDDEEEDEADEDGDGVPADLSDPDALAR